MAQFVNGPEAEVKEDGKEDREEVKPPEDEEEVEEVEEEEEEETEEEEESSDEDDEKIGAPFSNRPTYRELKAYDPKLLKKFPGLRDTFFRELEFSKRFPTVEDADEVLEKLTGLQEVEQRIIKGDPKDFLDILGNFDVNVQRKFVSGFLPSLYNTNKSAFAAITQPVLKNVLRAAIQQGKQHGNENLQNSAMHLHEFIFGDVDIEKGVPNPQEASENRVDPDRAEFEKERANFLQTRHREFAESVVGYSSRNVNKVIEESIPEGASSFESENFGDKVRKKLATVLQEDTAHLSVMRRITGQAEKAGFTKEFKDRAGSALLSRAKVALPAIIKEVRSEFLRGKKQSPNPVKRATASNSRPPARSDKQSQDRDSAVKSGKISELDFLKD